MKLEEIYHRCGLKQPEEYRKYILTEALFSGNELLQKALIEDKRRMGKTTNFIMQGIQNLFHGKSTLIFTHGASRARLSSINFERYSYLFPELIIERETQEQFVARFYPTANPRLRFAGIYNGKTQLVYPGLSQWDEVFDDHT